MKTGKKLDVITNFKDYGFNKPLFLIRGDVHKSPLLKVVDDEVESRCRDSNSGSGRSVDGSRQNRIAHQTDGRCLPRYRGRSTQHGIRERGRKSQFVDGR